MTNSSGTSGIVIKSDASGTGSLIFGSGAPNATIERYLSDNSWHQVSPSTTACTATNFYWNYTPISWMLLHNESISGSDSWSYIVDPNIPLNVGQGYMVWLDKDTKQDATAIMEGQLQATDLLLNVAFTDLSLGWNLLGNPFSSAIDLDEGIWGGNTTGTVYVWDGDFDEDGEYLASGGDLSDLTNNIIPISQGFFVRAENAGSFTIPAAARVHSTQNFYKNTTKKGSPFVKLSLTTGGYKSNIYVGFPEGGTIDFDNSLDADRLYSSHESPQMIVPEGDRELCINAGLPLIENEDRIVPVHIKYFINGTYQLVISNLDNATNTKVILEDLETGTLHDFSMSNTYSFLANEGDEPDRFLLHFRYLADGIEIPIDKKQDDINIYSIGNRVYILSKGKTINETGLAEVYDITGRLLYSKKIARDELVSFTVNSKSQYLFIKVVKQSAYSTKIVYIR